MFVLTGVQETSRAGLGSCADPVWAAAAAALLLLLLFCSDLFARQLGWLHLECGAGFCHLAAPFRAVLSQPAGIVEHTRRGWE